jgi:hypothetical protein
MQYQERPAGTKPTKAIIAGLAVVAIAGIGYYLWSDQAKNAQLTELPKAAPIQQAVAPEKAEDKPVYQEPVGVTPPEPLPDLNQSDVAVIAALQGLSVNGLLQMVISENSLRKFVRAIDAIEEGKLITEYRPVVSPQGAFAVTTFQAEVSSGNLDETESVEQFRISDNNYVRYVAYSNILSLLNTDAAAALYVRFYPLLNQAYQEMGLKKGNFHSVFIRAIDHMIAAPTASGDMILIHPKVYFQFADPALEKLPETHKLMLRMGPENARSIKTSLEGLRVKLLNKPGS